MAVALENQIQKEIIEIADGRCRYNSGNLKERFFKLADDFCTPYGGVLDYGNYSFFLLGSLFHKQCKIEGTITCKSDRPLISQPRITIVPPKGVALVLGMDKECHSCKADSLAIKQLLESRNFTTHHFVDPSSSELQEKLTQFALELKAGDTFVFYYSGHGGQVADENGDESDKLDETLILLDRPFLDDELRKLFAAFKIGVKILFLSDSCHSGTVYKDLSETPNGPLSDDSLDPLPIKSKFIAITSSREDELSLMGEPLSYFTNLLIKTWDSGNFDGTIKAFYENIHKESSSQEAQYYATGIDVKDFEAVRPFQL
ncbi:MAG: caspase family protein [Oligoflexia bacterium]|nr:caspase family protein [Oligoflexia bacterium]